MSQVATKKRKVDRTQEKDERTIRMMKATLCGVIQLTEKLFNSAWGKPFDYFFNDRDVVAVQSADVNDFTIFYCDRLTKEFFYVDKARGARSATRKASRRFQNLCSTPAS